MCRRCPIDHLEDLRVPALRKHQAETLLLRGVARIGRRALFFEGEALHTALYKLTASSINFDLVPANERMDACEARWPTASRNDATSEVRATKAARCAPSSTRPTHTRTEKTCQRCRREWAAVAPSRVQITVLIAKGRRTLSPASSTPLRKRRHKNGATPGTVDHPPHATLLDH